MAKVLSEAQLEQRRAAGRALAAKVSRDYYRYIGSMGGRTFMHNHFKRCAARVASMPRYSARLRAKAESYKVETGTRVMLALFAPDTDTGKRVSLRQLEAKEYRRLYKKHSQKVS